MDNHHVKRCLECNKRILQSIDTCPICGGKTIGIPAARAVDRSRFHLRRKFCLDCTNFGKHMRGDAVREGCGLMAKPCDVETAWLTNKDAWCPGGKSHEFAKLYPYSTARQPDIVPPLAWDDQVSPINERAIVTVAAGERAKEIAEYTVPQMAHYADKCGADLVVLSDDQFPEYRIGNKFRLAGIGQHYDRTLFVDVDVWMQRDTPNLFQLSRDRVWAHPDKNYLRWFAFFDADCGMWKDTQQVELPKHMKVYNTGFVLFSSEHALIWEKPKQPFFDTHTAEQTWVEIQARNAGVKFADLPLRYNLQWWMRDHWGRQDAFIYHLANCPHQERLEWLRTRAFGSVPAVA